MEFMVKSNTPGKRDGRSAIWMDGVLVADFTNLRLRDVPELRINRVGFGQSTLHSANEVPNIMYYDDIVMASSYIGPIWRGKQASSKTAGSDEKKEKPAEVAKPQTPRVSPELLAQWQGKLVQRVQRGISEKTHPYTDMRVGGAEAERVQVVAASEKVISVQLRDSVMAVPWSWMSPGESLALASNFLKDGQVEDHLLVAVFALAAGKSDLAEEHFARAQIADRVAGPARVKEVRTALGLK